MADGQHNILKVIVVGGQSMKHANLIILMVRILLGLTFLGALLIGIVLSISRNEFLEKDLSYMK